MRDTTKIMAIAQEALADIEQGNVGAGATATKESLKEIIGIAKRMDARTGTSDPSVKKGGS